jgi:hypothetical protein
MGWQPNYQTEGRIFGQYLLANHAHGRIAILYQNDDYGKNCVKGLKDSLAGAIPIGAEAAYETTDTDVNAQMAKLKASGVDIFFNVGTPKFRRRRLHSCLVIDGRFTDRRELSRGAPSCRDGDTNPASSPRSPARRTASDRAPRRGAGFAILRRSPP